MEAVPAAKAIVVARLSWGISGRLLEIPAAGKMMREMPFASMPIKITRRLVGCEAIDGGGEGGCFKV